jgi:small-conductance mechanosensitive channel
MRLTESTGWVAVQEWLTLYGMPIRIIAIVFAAIIMRWIVLVVLQRTVQRVVNGVKKNQQVESTREIVQSPLLAARIVQRTRTLGSVGTNLVTSLIAIVVLVLVLGELGVNLTAILASAGIIAAGLAVFEDQLGVGDSVVIGEVRGTVEMVGLRNTHVRASDGTLWFIRNGEILKLGNLSHDWGRAQIDLTVAATQPLEEVQQIALEAAGELHRDPLVARKIIGLAEVIGLREVTPEKVTLRLAIKTRPGVQDEVGRALSAVLLLRFDGAGIPLALQPIEGGTT